jgi:hypothetical protein
MAVPHYAYLKLKMPGNDGTNITVHGSFSRSDNCDREFEKIAAKFGVKQEVKVIDFFPKQLTIQDSNLKEVTAARTRRSNQMIMQHQPLKLRWQKRRSLKEELVLRQQLPAFLQKPSALT